MFAGQVFYPIAEAATIFGVPAIDEIIDAKDALDSPEKVDEY
jgi:hypothetical protein